MSDVIVSGVEMKDDGTRRITTITVTEGRGGGVWPTHPSSIPPAVRDKLLGWLAPDAPSGDATAPAETFADGELHVNAGAHLQLASEPPGVDVRVGFRAETP